MERWGPGEEGETEERWPTEAGEGVGIDRVGRGRGRERAEEM